MRRTALVIAALGLLAASPAAHAGTRTYTFRYGPVHMNGFQTRLPKVAVKAPHVNGYIRWMYATLHYGNGRRVSIRRVMLHHIVFFNMGDGSHHKPGSCVGRYGEPFFGTGEEHERLMLPAGYGYRIDKDDRWRMNTMLMSHSLLPFNVYVQYQVKVVTGARLRPVKPYWIRANGCGSKHPSYSVNGPRSSDRTFHWRAPITGRIVAAGGHLHGGAETMTLNEPGCGNRELFDTNPMFGTPSDLVYRIRPVLHEPGPIATRYFMSRQGIPVIRGQRLDLRGIYDPRYVRPRVMAIMHIYVAPTRRRPRSVCGALPADRREVFLRHAGRLSPPWEKVPLNIVNDQGHVQAVDTLTGPIRSYAGGTTVDLARGVFAPRRISVPLGARLTWRFRDDVAHNVLLANGPFVYGTTTILRGVHSVRLNKPGRYQFFCYLHPVSMQQEVYVRPR